MTQRLESQIGGGIAVLVVLAVIFIVLSNLGAIDKTPIDGMSVGAAKYSEPIQIASCDEGGANGPATNVERDVLESEATIMSGVRRTSVSLSLVPVLNFERAAGWRSATSFIKIFHDTLGDLPLAAHRFL